jgi:archaellum biogenesis ATPase FlaH
VSDEELFDNVSISTKILEALHKSEAFARQVMPHLKREYFELHEVFLFELVKRFYDKYNSIPTIDATAIELDNLTHVMEDGKPNYITAPILKTIKEELKSFRATNKDALDKTEFEWLIDASEKFCKDRALFISLMKSIQIANGDAKNLSVSAIPSLMQEALAVTFDTNIGHDFFDSVGDRYDFFHSTVSKIPFQLDILNHITNGGVENKTLNLVMAGTGVGKSIFLCALAAHYMMQGHNVLYITMEMAEEKIAKRIDANLMDTSLDVIDALPREVYVSKIQKLMERTVGRLKIKEYPTSAAHVGHIRALLNELRMKKNFVPTIIIVDYLNIMCSQRLVGAAVTNLYQYIKNIAEELRGLAVETKCPIWTATQVNRDGLKSGDVDLTDTSESMGLPHTLDFMLALIEEEELKKLGQIIGKQLKNRYGDKDRDTKFMIGLDKSKMRFYDLPNTSVWNPGTGPNSSSGNATNASQNLNSALSKYGKVKV